MDALLVAEFLIGVVVGALIVDYVMTKTEAKRHREWKKRIGL